MCRKNATRIVFILPVRGRSSADNLWKFPRVGYLFTKCNQIYETKPPHLGQKTETLFNKLCYVDY